MEDLANRYDIDILKSDIAERRANWTPRQNSIYTKALEQLENANESNNWSVHFTKTYLSISFGLSEEESGLLKDDFMELSKTPILPLYEHTKKGIKESACIALIVGAKGDKENFYLFFAPPLIPILIEERDRQAAKPLKRTLKTCRSCR
jgi:hypothetical protein